VIIREFERMSEKTAGIQRKWRKDVPDKYIFFTPTITLILVMAIFPLFFSLTLTFTSWHLATGNLSFIGGANYVRLVTDPLFWNSIKNTIIYVFLGVGLQYSLGLGLALLMNQNIRGKKVFRVVFLIPMMLTPVAVGYLFKMLYNENIGPINHIITSLGLPAMHFVTNSKWAIYFLILVDTWQWTPFMFILLLAGLQSLPHEPYEAAIVDGANKWQLFRYITLPLMLPISFTALLIRSLEIFKMIDIINVITGGGPGISTETSTVYAYLAGLRAFDLGYGATIAWFLLIVVVIFTMLLIRLFKKLAPDTAGL
jgi:multiple sugar transport system permease protein